MLSERTPVVAWVSTLVAMTGVMIVLRPNLALGPAALLPVLAALGMALLVIFNRKMAGFARSEEHTSELQSLMRLSYAVFCLKKQKTKPTSLQHAHPHHHTTLPQPPSTPTP